MDTTYDVAFIRRRVAHNNPGPSKGTTNFHTKNIR